MTQGKEGMKGEAIEQFWKGYLEAGEIRRLELLRKLPIWDSKRMFAEGMTATLLKSYIDDALEAKPDSANASLDRLDRNIRKVLEDYALDIGIGAETAIKDVLDAEKAAQKGEVAER